MHCMQVQFYFQVALASPAPPYDRDNLQKLGEKNAEKEPKLEQEKFVFADTIENLPTTTTFTPTGISADEDSRLPPLPPGWWILDPDPDGPGWISCPHGASHLWHARPLPTPSPPGCS